MRRRRLPLGVLVPAGLVVLVGTLATLQYRWLGQVSEAERDQMRTSLERSAREFAADFDGEISRIYLALQPADGAAVAAGQYEDFAARYDRWREAARFPDVVRAMYFASREDAEPLRRYAPDERTFIAVEWPAELAPVRDRLDGEMREIAAGAEGRPAIMQVNLSGVFADVPAIVVPLTLAEQVPFQAPAGTAPPALGSAIVRRAPMPTAEVMVGFHMSHAPLVVHLDSTYLRQAMLPTLAERHFPEQGADRYRVLIVDNTSAPVLHRPVGVSIPADQADVSEPFFRLRMSTFGEFTATTGRLMSWFVTQADGADALPKRVQLSPQASSSNVTVFLDEHRVAGSPPAAAATAALRTASGGWQIRLQHADGSLDAAVGNARARNLWLSFGMLTLLVMSMGLIMLNAGRSERLAAQQMDFVATVSHELRTPLAVIRSAAQNMQAGVVIDPGQAKRYGDLIEDEGRRLTDMVEQVLEYAGLSGGRRAIRTRPVDVRALVGDVVAAAEPHLAAEGFEVSVQVPADVPLVLADEDALRRAVQNLIVNAVKHAAEGRWVGVTADAVTGRKGVEVRVAVSDHGRGIDAAELPHIFEPFYRGRYALERQIHGNGLGLSLVKRIAEAHGGRLSVKSVASEGSTFTIHMPAFHGETAADPVADPAPDAGAPTV
jgi:signal transduction histidine kinase